MVERKMFSTLKKLLITSLIGLFFAASAGAASLIDYNEDAFKKARNEGKTIVLDFHAVWCGVCKKQQPVLSALLQNPEFKDVVAFNVDYDWAVDLTKDYAVTSQATIVVLKGDKEVARATGITDRDEIKALLMKGV
jgi:thioredoxin 1